MHRRESRVFENESLLSRDHRVNHARVPDLFKRRRNSYQPPRTAQPAILNRPEKIEIREEEGTEEKRLKRALRCVHTEPRYECVCTCMCENACTPLISASVSISHAPLTTNARPIGWPWTSSKIKLSPFSAHRGVSNKASRHGVALRHRDVFVGRVRRANLSEIPRARLPRIAVLSPSSARQGNLKFRIFSATLASSLVKPRESLSSQTRSLICRTWRNQ